MIRIAVIGPRGTIPHVMKYGKTKKGIELVPYAYESPEQSILVAEQAMNCDVLLFTGPVPYFFVKDNIRAAQPAVYIPIDEYSLTLSLLDIKVNFKENFEDISFDIPSTAYVEQVAKELKIESSSSWHVKDYSNIIQKKGTPFYTEDIVRFHHDLWVQGRTKLALTCIDYVYDSLQKMGVPCIPVSIPEKSIQDALDKAIGYGELVVSKHSQIAIILVSLDRIGDNPEEDHDDNRLNLFRQELVQLTKKMDASVQQVGSNQFIVYGTRGGIEYITNFFNEIPFLPDLEQLAGQTLSLGFGLGRSVKEAKTHAKLALLHAQECTEKSTAYVVTEEKKVLGPVNGIAKNYRLKTEDEQFIQIAKATGSSVATISKLVEWNNIRKQSSFTAQELAEYLQITRRSAERILKKLLDRHFVHVVGEEQPYQKGRPRSVYQMTIY